MNETNIARQRESDISSCSDDESNGENYENYRTKSLPEGYTAYRKAGQADEVVYDRYDSDYEGAETPDQGVNQRSKQSCCKKGRLLDLKNAETEFLTEIFFTKKAFLKDCHWQKVTNIVHI